jgi:CubicO group peptidase (beta-lactamase class C family)
MITQGSVAPGFEKVAQAFAENFEERDELGAGLAVLLEGDPVVDLWGGYADRNRSRLWESDTLVPVYSTTKGVAALVVALLVERGALDYEAPVAAIWPAFGVNGKDRITLAELLSHQAGLPGFKEEIDPALWLDPQACAAALAALPPLWPPGTRSGYHPLTWGYLVGEIVRRVSGKSLGAVLREDFCDPSGIDFWIGLPESEHERVGEMTKPRDLPQLGEITELKRLAFLTKWAAPDRGGAVWRSIEIPSANGHGTAMGVAQLYGVYAEGGVLDGDHLIGPATFEALRRPRVSGDDLVLPTPMRFAAGPQLNDKGLYGPNPETLAHPGWGGSFGMGDPARRLSIGYVCNRQDRYLQGDPRARALIDAVYDSLTAL